MPALPTQWIYLLGPITGSAVAVGLTQLFHGSPATDDKAVEAAQGEPAGSDGG